MKRVYLAIAHPDERSALRLMLTLLDLQVVGDAGNWLSALALAPAAHPDMVLVDWALISNESRESLLDLRLACTATVLIILMSHLEAREQAALSAGADAFISRGETSERVIERLQAAVRSLPV